MGTSIYDDEVRQDADDWEMQRRLEDHPIRTVAMALEATESTHPRGPRWVLGQGWVSIAAGCLDFKADPDFYVVRDNQELCEVGRFDTLAEAEKMIETLASQIPEDDPRAFAYTSVLADGYGEAADIVSKALDNPHVP